jgi:hypothetical protein
MKFIHSLEQYKHYIKKIKRVLNIELETGGNNYERVVREASKGFLTIIRTEKQGDRVFIKIGFTGSKECIEEITLEKKHGES